MIEAELVIVSYNRLPTLRATLEGLRRTYPELPVCVGLQGPDRHSELGLALPQDFGVRLLTFEQPSITRTLNACITSSNADVVLMTDDDALPCPGWLEAHLDAFEAEPGLAYTSGREIRMAGRRSAKAELLRIAVETAARPFVPGDATIDGRVVGWMTGLGLLLTNMDRTGTCRINTPRGCNMALDRRTFSANGGFDERFRGNGWGFEPEFGVRLARQGKLGRFVGSAAVLHAEQPTGGSRQAGGGAYLADFRHNHRVLLGTLGRRGWIGSVPRLAAKRASLRRAARAPAGDQAHDQATASS